MRSAAPPSSQGQAVAPPDGSAGAGATAGAAQRPEGDGAPAIRPLDHSSRLIRAPGACHRGSRTHQRIKSRARIFTSTQAAKSQA